jgi:hypothetical protein
MDSLGSILALTLAAAATVASSASGCAGSDKGAGEVDAGFGGPVCTPGSAFDLNGR